MARDEIGHLAWRAGGAPYGGLCHCALGEAHYAGDDGSRARPGAWLLDLGGPPAPCPVCGRPIPGSGHTPACMEPGP